MIDLPPGSVVVAGLERERSASLIAWDIGLPITIGESKAGEAVTGNLPARRLGFWVFSALRAEQVPRLSRDFWRLWDANLTWTPARNHRAGSEGSLTHEPASSTPGTRADWFVPGDPSVFPMADPRSPDGSPARLVVATRPGRIPAAGGAPRTMDKLERLEAQSVYILREAFRHFDRLCMLWSMGKDSTVLLWLARKAFFGHVPIPLVHIDTGFEIPEALTYRDRLARELKLTMIVGRHDQALTERRTYVHTREDFPDGDERRLGRKQCCAILRTAALKQTLDGSGPRWRLDLASGKWVAAEDREPWTGVIVGARADEEGSRSKERYFSPRNHHSQWDVGDQPPELWNQFKTDYAPGTHVRIHPLLDWTELDIWEYIEREAIPLIPLYFDGGSGTRYRSLGCWPCQEPIASRAGDVRAVIAELASGSLKDIAERSGRLQDHEGRGGLEELRRDGYM